MGITPTGKICEGLLRAIDEFCGKYQENINNYICLCLDHI